MNSHTTEAIYRERVTLVLEYIRNHPGESLSLDNLARVGGFSPFHMHRIFTAFTGVTLGETVRRARLTRAWQQLAGSTDSITQIALDNGYDTPAAFSKAFKQIYQISPSVVRRMARSGEALSRPDSPQVTLLLGQRRNDMKPEFRTLPETKVVYVTSTGLVNGNFNQAADRAFERICAYLDQHQLWDQVAECLGISPDEPGAVAPAQQRYQGGFFVKPGASFPMEGEVEQLILPAGRYAIFLHAGAYETLGQTWGAIYRDWLPGSGVKLRDLPPFEVYLNEKGKVPPEALRTEIYIPVE